MRIAALLAAQASMLGNPATDHRPPSASALHPPHDPAPGSLVDQVGRGGRPRPDPLLQAKGGLVHGRGHRASLPRRAAAVLDGDSAAE